MNFLNKFKFNKIKKDNNKNHDDNVKNLDAFYGKSSNWLYDIYQSQSVWLNRALIGLVILSILLLISLISNLLLFPLKQKVPYLYILDKNTGEITKMGELEPSKLQEDWIMARYFLNRYVINRESYDYDNIEYPYQITWAMTATNIRKNYEDDVNSETATSPYKVYGKNKSVIVNVLSISQLNKNTATVRFEKILRDHDAGVQQKTQKEAIIKWKYVNEPVTQKELDRDPLGFKVTYYEVTSVNVE